jgi:hypothetical protein
MVLPKQVAYWYKSVAKKTTQPNGLATTQATLAQVNLEHLIMQRRTDRPYQIYLSLL